MSDTQPERNSNSKSNLIDVQHVGVLAEVNSGLKKQLTNYTSSTETEDGQLFYKSKDCRQNKYNKFSNEPGLTENDSTTAEYSKVLYEMKTSNITKDGNVKKAQKLTPSKIEFQLYNNRYKTRLRRTRRTSSQKTKATRKLFQKSAKEKNKQETSFLKRFYQPISNLKTKCMEKTPVANIIDDLPEPKTNNETDNIIGKDVRINIYPFDHGCAEYLKTYDTPPQVLSIILAEHAVSYATRFWAEFFGSIQIGVAFMVTFLLQAYRFLLYAFINTLLVQLLLLTSDYLVKPLLTVIFNGFLQPPLIFCFNILSSFRDITAPVADTINNFMKPLATVGNSLRLFNGTYNKRNVVKQI